MKAFAKDLSSTITSFFKVEKNIPLPTTTHGNTRYPFQQMQVGDSFLVEGNEKFTVRSAAYAYARAHGTKYKTRADGVGTRVWRIK